VGISVSIIEPGVSIHECGKRAKRRGCTAGQLPQEGHDLYDPAVAAMRQATEKTARDAIPPSAVAKAVVHALTADKPRTRYVVGTDARIQALVARVVPDRMKDWLVARELGIRQTL
jgi:hypothetical protein